MREQRPQAQQDDGIPLHARRAQAHMRDGAWSGISRQDYIIAKLADTQVEVRSFVSVQKALRDSVTDLAKEVRLTASYG